MKKITANGNSDLSRSQEDNGLGRLVTELRGLIQSARHAAATTVNTLQVLTNFEIGRRIVEHEQKGAKRAEYGKELLKELSARLKEEFGRGFSEDNLYNMRRFYLVWKDRVGEFPRRLLENSWEISQKPSAKLPLTQKGQTASDQLAPVRIFQTSSEKLPFTLSWSHYVLLLTVKNSEERSFYETEATNKGWSVPELKRQVDSCLYERLALSRDKEGVRQLANEGQLIVKPEDMLKEPYILEFLGLDEKAGYSESNLETAIIDRLEHFLLELGKGFLFEARQKPSPSTRTTSSSISSFTTVCCAAMCSSTSNSANSAIRIWGRCRCM